jgi:hypothetical protein
MKEYQDLGHMEEVTQPTDPSPSDEGDREPNYLPHHFVLKEESTTTKFRVVFDGSAKTASGVSLNECLYVGPTIQDNLFSLLLRFRFHVVALTADIVKMYRQFRVQRKHQDLQRIVWRDSPELPIREFRLLTLTYGTGPAPFLATRCLKQLAGDEKEKYPEAAHVLSRDFYVDDLMSGESTPERAINLQQQLSGIVEAGAMEIRKWASNDSVVMKAIPENLRATKGPLELDPETSIKALGVKWNPVSDCFVFSVGELPQGKVTKRLLLSELAKVFDPLGWLSPTTINAKIIFQDLWKLGVGWDEELPAELKIKWDRYQTEINHIKSIQIPRCLVSTTIVGQQLNGFSDASEKAYAAAVYLRCEMSDGSVMLNLVTGKTKVAPIKQVALPRLELCGSLLLAKLILAVKTSTSINCQAVAWTDSTIVLHWLAGLPSRWKTFVANRVAEIQELIPAENWHHVKSEENPADCASRGIDASELVNHSLWWNGPEWLKESTLPSFPYEFDKSSVDLEERSKPLLVAASLVVAFVFSRHYYQFLHL